jgi:hypothetical protein
MKEPGSFVGVKIMELAMSRLTWAEGREHSAKSDYHSKKVAS